MTDFHELSIHDINLDVCIKYLFFICEMFLWRHKAYASTSIVCVDVGVCMYM